MFTEDQLAHAANAAVAAVQGALGLPETETSCKSACTAEGMILIIFVGAAHHAEAQATEEVWKQKPH